MKVYSKSNLPVSALTNNTYENSMNTFNLAHGDEATDAFKDASYSLKRFIWAGLGVKNWDPKKSLSAHDYAFKILEKVTVNRTMFSIVYDVKGGLVYFKTKSNSELRFFNFNRLDFSCRSPVKFLDMEAEIKGDVTDKFKKYTIEANYNLIKKSFMGTGFLRNTPDAVLQQMARYPEMLKCID
jgi:hypothetical protein